MYETYTHTSNQVFVVCVCVCVRQKDSCSTDELDSWLLEKINSCISNMFLHEDQEAFSDLFKLSLHHNVTGKT